MKLWTRLKIFKNLRALMYLVVGGVLIEWGCGSEVMDFLLDRFSEIEGL